MKILTFTSLYPNAAMPNHGVFVENRMRRVAETGAAEIRVVAPVPYFPFTHPRFGGYARFARAPRSETRHGLEIRHPRYLVVPKVGMTLAPDAMVRASLPVLRALRADGFDFDLIDAHYYYPDGVAAARLGAALGVPVVITARGTDINLIPEHPKPRRMILEAAARAAASITVCDALRDAMIDLGADGEKIHTLRNGVDLALFRPVERTLARSRFLGLSAPDGPLIVSVGALIERKGHHLTIEAMRDLPANVRLLIAGAGAMQGALERQIAAAGLQARVTLLGTLSHDQLPALYTAADVMVLASSREGWANVLLESMACGSPVAATAIWGTPEVVRDPVAGRLIPERSAAAIAHTVSALLADLPDRAATRAFAEQFSWDATTAGLLRLFREIIANASDDRAA